MRNNNNIQQNKALTEKQIIILKLRLAMATRRYDVVESLGKEYKSLVINKII